MALNFTIAKDDKDLLGILALQTDNHRNIVSKDEKVSEGFVSVRHDLELLRQMNNPYPHVVALDSELVVGYTLVMLSSMRKVIPMLVPMFEKIDNIAYKGKILSTTDYFIMGQVCIAKSHRKKGIFRSLYSELAVRMKEHFDYIITEVSVSNRRSLDAHLAVGFNSILSYTDELDTWEILLFELKP